MSALLKMEIILGNALQIGVAHHSLFATHYSLTLTIRCGAEPISNQATEPAATAAPSAAMTCISQDVLPTLLLGVCETAAAAESDLSAGAAVSVLAAFTAGAAAGRRALLVGGQIDLVGIVRRGHPHGLAIDHKLARWCDRRAR